MSGIVAGNWRPIKYSNGRKCRDKAGPKDVEGRHMRCEAVEEDTRTRVGGSVSSCAAVHNMDYHSEYVTQ